jgi:O-antigen/teichoic acid export membrane protein
MLFPKLVATKPDVRHGIGLQATILTAATMLPIVVTGALLAPNLVDLLFGKSFRPAAMPLVLLMPGVLLLGVQTALVQLLNSFGYPSFVLYSWVVVVAAKIGLNLLLLPQFGINGVAASHSATCLLLLLLVSFKVWRQVGVIESRPSAEIVV